VKRLKKSMGEPCLCRASGDGYTDSPEATVRQHGGNQVV